MGSHGFCRVRRGVGCIGYRWPASIAQKAVDDALGRDNRVAAAAVTVEPGTGRVITFAVNRTFGVPKKGEFDKTQVLLPDAVAMQPGSNFKPITLAAALERGYDPNSAIYAPPVYAPADQNYPGSGFQNFGSSGSGYLDAYAGIARSSNRKQREVTLA